jgi:hypothetical protein
VEIIFFYGEAKHMSDYPQAPGCEQGQLNETALAAGFDCASDRPSGVRTTAPVLFRPNPRLSRSRACSEVEAAPLYG